MSKLVRLSEAKHWDKFVQEGETFAVITKLHGHVKAMSLKTKMIETFSDEEMVEIV